MAASILRAQFPPVCHHYATTPTLPAAPQSAFQRGRGREELELRGTNPGGVHLSFFASAFAFGTPDYPLEQIPFQAIVDRAAEGTYKAKPARVFHFEEIQKAHRLMESGGANGKIVVTVD